MAKGEDKTQQPKIQRPKVDHHGGLEPRPHPEEYDRRIRVVGWKGGKR